jgi:hypothetical protein
MSATEIVTSPAITAPLLRTRSSVSHSDTRSLSRIKTSSIVRLPRPRPRRPRDRLLIELVEPVEQLALARLELLLGNLSRLQEPMLLGQLRGDPVGLLLQLLFRRLMDLAQDPEDEGDRRGQQIVNHQHPPGS